jgi:hypothetical protein
MGWRLSHRPYPDFQPPIKPTALGFAPGCMRFLIALKPTLEEMICQIGSWDEVVKSFYLSWYSIEFITVSAWFTYSPFGTYLLMIPDLFIDWSNPCPVEPKGFMKWLNIECCNVDTIPHLFNLPSNKR